jgi:hypothetical protein
MCPTLTAWFLRFLRRLRQLPLRAYNTPGALVVPPPPPVAHFLLVIPEAAHPSLAPMASSLVFSVTSLRMSCRSATTPRTAQVSVPTRRI